MQYRSKKRKRRIPSSLKDFVNPVDAAHLKGCKREDCARCKFIRVKTGWIRKLGGMPWLVDGFVDQEWGVGCRLCAESMHAGYDELNGFGLFSKSLFAKYAIRTTEQLRFCRQPTHSCFFCFLRPQKTQTILFINIFIILKIT